MGRPIVLCVQTIDVGIIIIKSFTLTKIWKTGFPLIFWSHDLLKITTGSFPSLLSGIRLQGQLQLIWRYWSSQRRYKTIWDLSAVKEQLAYSKTHWGELLSSSLLGHYSYRPIAITIHLLWGTEWWLIVILVGSQCYHQSDSTTHVPLALYCKWNLFSTFNISIIMKNKLFCPLSCIK